jgi:hypothetical protein
MGSDPDELAGWRGRLLEEATAVIERETSGRPARFREALLAAAEHTRPPELDLLACGAAAWSGGDPGTGMPAAVASHLLRAAVSVHTALPGFRTSFPSCSVPVHERFDEGTALLVGDALVPLAVTVLVSRGGRHGAAMVDDAMEALGAGGILAGISLELEGRSTTLTDDVPPRELWAGSLGRFSALSGARLAGATERQMDQVSLLGLECGRAWSLMGGTPGLEGGSLHELNLEAATLLDDARTLAGSGENGGMLREIVGCLRNLSPSDPSDLFFEPGAG